MKKLKNEEKSNKNLNFKIQTLNYTSNSKFQTPNSKLHSGITLIALVVTIVVLLILAGITINAILGPNSIFESAKTADVETRGGEVEEARDMWKSQNTISKYTDRTQKQLATLLEELLEQKLITEEEKQEIEETGKVTIGSRTIEFTEDAEEFNRYCLMLDKDMGFEKLVIEFLDSDLVDFVAQKVGKNSLIDDLTDEEVFMVMMAKDNPELANKTFQEFIEELYNAGEIKEKYTTVKEVYMAPQEDGGGGMTEAQYEVEIIAIRQELADSGAIVNDIQVINPDGNVMDKNYYVAPCEPNDYVFAIRYSSQEYKIKISIGDYVIASSDGEKSYLGMENRITKCLIHNPIEERYAFALDVKNKKPLTIKNGKMKVKHEVVIDNEYIVNFGEFSALNLSAYASDVNTGVIQVNLEVKRVNGLATFICGEGTIKGYVPFDLGVDIINN